MKKFDYFLSSHEKEEYFFTLLEISYSRNVTPDMIVSFKYILTNSQNQA